MQFHKSFLEDWKTFNFDNFDWMLGGAQLGRKEAKCESEIANGRSFYDWP